jgi:glycosyltransferase involved in cell wall biosynthesis
MKKIVFFTKYTSKGPSSRYRTYQYSSFFDENFDTTYLPFFDDNYINAIFKNKKVSLFTLIKFFLKRMFQVLSKMGSKDLIIIEYELIPYFPPIFEYLFKLTGVKYILDFDDAVFHNYDNNKNKLVQIFLGNKINVIAKNASHIITGSPYLTSFLKRYNSNVTEIPTSISYDHYMKNKNTCINDKFIIGWLGSNSTSNNLLIIKDVINKVSDDFPNIIFRFCGFNNLL